MVRCVYGRVQGFSTQHIAQCTLHTALSLSFFFFFSRLVLAHASAPTMEPVIGAWPCRAASSYILATCLCHPCSPCAEQFSQYTCISCRVAFSSGEIQRDHYRRYAVHVRHERTMIALSDWHRYNLKRKVATLAPISVEAFRERVLTQQSEAAQQASASAFSKQVMYFHPQCTVGSHARIQ